MDGELSYPSLNLIAGTKSQNNTAAAIGSATCSEVLIQNDPSSLVNLLVGDVTSQPVVLTPGQHIVLPVSNLNLVYAKSASSTATLNYLYRR
jgi:hypothetical protein